jgi:hypothetical protein
MTPITDIEIEMVTTCDRDAQPLDYLFQEPDYREQDEARLKAWRKGRVALRRHPRQGHHQNSLRHQSRMLDYLGTVIAWSVGYRE